MSLEILQSIYNLNLKHQNPHNELIHDKLGVSTYVAILLKLRNRRWRQGKLSTSLEGNRKQNLSAERKNIYIYYKMSSCSAVEIHSHCQLLQPYQTTECYQALSSILLHCRLNGRVLVHPQNKLHHYKVKSTEENRGRCCCCCCQPLQACFWERSQNVTSAFQLQHKYSMIKQLLKIITWKRICSNTLNFKFMQSAFQTVLRISEPFTSLFSNPQKCTTQLQMNQYTDNAPIMLKVDHHHCQ